MKLAPSSVLAIASAYASGVAPLAAGHKAALLPDSWSQVPELDLLIRGSTTIAVTDARLFEWYLQNKTFADSTFTTTHAANTLTDTGHGLRTGTGPVYVSNAGGALPTPLVAGTPYWTIFVDANTLQLATSLENALKEVPIDLEDDGSGTHTMADDPTDTNENGITKWPEVASVMLLGDAGDGAITLAAGSQGYRKTFPHRYGAVAYSVQATLDTGTVDLELYNRGVI